MLTRERYQGELVRIQSQIKTVEEALTRLKMQEQLAKLFLELSESSRSGWVKEGSLKKMIESAPAFFRLERSGEAIVTLYRHGNEYWIDLASTDQGTLWFEPNELRTRSQSAEWRSEGPIETTTLTLEKWLVHPAWTLPPSSVLPVSPSIPSLVGSPSVPSLVGSPSVPSLVGSSSVDRSVLGRSVEPSSDRGIASTVPVASGKLTTAELIQSMAQSFLQSNSPTAGMGIFRESDPIVINPGLTGDLSSPDLLRAMAKARGRPMTSSSE